MVRSVPSRGALLSVAALVLLGTLASAPGLPADAPLTETPQAQQQPPTFLRDEPELGPRWRALESEETQARIWYWGWTGFLGAVVAGEAVIAVTTDNQGTKIGAYYNMAFSGAGMLAVLLLPPPAAYGLDAIRAMPEDTDEQRAAKGRALRELFDRAAKQEAFYRSPLNHIIGLTVNASLSAILYFGYKLGGRALLNLVAGSAIWEAQVWTHPVGARDASEALGKGPGLQAHVVFLGNGFGIAGSF